MAYKTPEEVAKDLGVSRRTVYEWLRLGQLRGYRAGKKWVIKTEDMEAFLKSAGSTPNAIARELRVSIRTVYAWLRSGKLKGSRVGRRWVIKPEDVEVFLRRGRQQ